MDRCAVTNFRALMAILRRPVAKAGSSKYNVPYGIASRPCHSDDDFKLMADFRMLPKLCPVESCWGPAGARNLPEDTRKMAKTVPSELTQKFSV